MTYRALLIAFTHNPAMIDEPRHVWLFQICDRIFKQIAQPERVTPLLWPAILVSKRENAPSGEERSPQCIECNLLLRRRLTLHGADLLRNIDQLPPLFHVE